MSSTPPAASGRRRVVLFGSFAPSLLHFRGRLIEEMVRRGHEVIAVASGITDQDAARLRALGASSRSIDFGRTSLRPFEAMRASRKLRALIAELRPDVMIAYTIKPIILGAKAAKSAGVPTFVPLVTGLGYAFTGGLEPVRVVSRVMATILYRLAFRQASIALFQNPDDLQDFRKLRVLPPSVSAAVINGSGVDVEYYRQVPPPAGASFLMIARLVGDKGVREFGEAARRLKAEYPDVRISLIGAIDTEPHAITPAELETMIEGGVDYLGALPDVRPQIAAHSVYVLPSYREGTPRSVLEGLSIGRAIITTDAPGCRQTVIDGENGILVPPRDAEALLQAMRRLVREPERLAQMGQVSRRIAEEKYDVRKVNEELLRHAGL